MERFTWEYQAVRVYSFLNLGNERFTFNFVS